MQKTAAEVTVNISDVVLLFLVLSNICFDDWFGWLGGDLFFLGFDGAANGAVFRRFDSFGGIK